MALSTELELAAARRRLEIALARLREIRFPKDRTNERAQSHFARALAELDIAKQEKK